MKKWYFPSAKGIGINGFNNIGEEFKDNPIQALAKEICQNSLDTKMNPEYKESSDKTIKVTFSEFWMKTNNFPGGEEFLKILEDEYSYNSNYYEHDKTVPNFYKNAIDCLKEEKICCLRISDFNTTGLIGSNKKNHSPWCDLTKNAGVSDKPEGSGGSKGKGKFASFICSSLYTVFYSTYAVDELKASCGIARLSGYELKDGNQTIGEGYYEEDNNVIKECISFDENYNRNSYGTDIFIIGFKNDYENWREQIIASIIDNFLVAIIRNDLKVEVDQYILSSSTIDELIKNEKISPYLNQLTEKYYKIMISENDEIITEKYSMFEQDDLIFKIRVDKDSDNGLTNRVAVVRSTGMKILDLKNLPRLGFYHGILEMRGNKVNDYFRKLENASHNTWSASRGENVNEAKEKIDELKTFVKNTIKKYMIESLLDEIDAEGVGEFLPDEDEFVSDSNEEKGESIEDEQIQTIQIEETPIKADKKNKKADEGEEDTELDDDGNIVDIAHVVHDEPDPNPGLHPNPIDPPKAKYINITRQIIPQKLRLIEDNDKYQLIFSARENESVVKLEFSIYGENSNEKAHIKNAQAKKVNKLLNSKMKAEYSENSIFINNILKDDVYILEFEVDSDDMWTLEVNVYGRDK